MSIIPPVGGSVWWSYALPGAGQWFSAVVFLACSLVGWIISPACWLVAGPFRWLAFMAGTAAGESGWDAGIVGDKGISVGIAQFSVSTYGDIVWLRPFGDWRKLPCASGVASARYVQQAILADPLWLVALACPGVGVVAIRTLWTHGLDGLSIENLREKWRVMLEEQPKALTAFLTWRAFGAIPAIVVGYLAFPLVCALLRRWKVIR